MNKKELMAIMSNIAETKIQNYKNDYYDYDLPVIEDSEVGDEYVWLVRDCGTFMPKLTGFMAKEIIETIERNMRVSARYIVSKIGEDGFTFEAVSPGDIKEYFKQAIKFRVEFIESDGTAKIFEGHFPSERKMRKEAEKIIALDNNDWVRINILEPR